MLSYIAAYVMMILCMVGHIILIRVLKADAEVVAAYLIAAAIWGHAIVVRDKNE